MKPPPPLNPQTSLRLVQGRSGSTANDPNGNGEVSVAERCRKRYGVYHPDLVLSVTHSGAVSIKPNARNYRLLLEQQKDLDLKFSEFDQCEFIRGKPLTDKDILKLRDELIGFLRGDVRTQDVRDAVELAAHQHPYNPLTEWFNDLPANAGTDLLDSWLTTVCGAADTPITRVIGRKWLISAVARALKPGCYVEGSLIFFGDQAAGKTWLFTNLNPRKEYYSGEELNISNKKEAAALCAGKFIIELGELNSIRRNELNAMKQYLTATEDTYQPKYKQRAVTVPRMHIFGGSTNEETFLTDPTGNRRFWCVAAGDKIDQELFLKIKEPLWAQAVASFRRGDQWTLTEDERKMLEDANAAFLVEDPLVTFLEHELAKTWASHDEISSFLLQRQVLLPYKDKVHPKTVATAMQALGWKKSQITSGENKGQKCYLRPGSVSAMGGNVE